ncbi:MAG TPA: sugar phosphate nucleotidyltransferase, partial [Anaerolineales bacterium]|nr:sugar phosphate nucleotidyltransferase [Anaerolineales bacterium]
MKVVILAGGLGTRLSEETEVKPKPMVEIGERPILWHIMKHYACYGFNEFIIALGYKGNVIKRYFLESTTLHESFSIDMRSDKVTIHKRMIEDWIVHLVDTGLDSST